VLGKIHGGGGTRKREFCYSGLCEGRKGEDANSDENQKLKDREDSYKEGKSPGLEGKKEVLHTCPCFREKSEALKGETL